MEKIIDVRHLQKSYQGHLAVQSIDFHVKRGQIFALLGPNGAGKSTVLNILGTCLPADSGQIVIDGIPLNQRNRNNRDIQKRIGIVFQKGVLDRLLTVEENLSIRGSLYGLSRRHLQERIRQTALMTGIYHLLLRTYGELSGGEQRRCDIARALLPMPKLLFLDEPTTGLDPEIRASLWETLLSIQARTDMTIFMTTHYMEEAARADYITILNQGKIAAAGTPEALKSGFSKTRLILYFSGLNQLESLENLLKRNHIPFHTKHRQVFILLAHTSDALPILKLCQGYFSEFEVVRGTIEHAYLSIVEKQTAPERRFMYV